MLKIIARENTLLSILIPLRSFQCSITQTKIWQDKHPLDLTNGEYDEIFTNRDNCSLLFNGASGKKIVIFSSRKPQLINPLLKQYTEKTGVKFELRTGKDGALIQQLKIEGEKAKADVLMTVDAGNLWYAKTQNLFSPLGAKNFNHISQHLKDSENHWVGLSIRARTIVYHSDRVKNEEIKNYEDLALPTWKNRLCLRTSKKVYNQSLVGMLIHELGEEKAKSVVKGWVNNTVKIFSSDTKLLKQLKLGNVTWEL